MSRIFWILVLMIGAVVFVKPLRERATPYVEFALNPLYEWEAKNRVNNIYRVLERTRAEGNPLPRPKDFQDFLTEREGTNAALDPWGTPYFLVRERKFFRVSSAGADRLPNTADDIHSTPEVAVDADRRR
ncbi:hypothetical protein [Longimicrobium sp.]|uniref:hypothetical protein n=1 Tax=Longimicrobium sp. TaxID=2029185 RepID=UPI002E331E7E|nr:hypothetical protein [Longimicrobium sp.]HEX6042266.1 hypothetical protein [Longimicrobium sp.]